MRLPFLAVAAALSISGIALADPPAPAPAAKKVVKPVRFDGVTINGKREVPVAVVLTRDDSVKDSLDSSVNQHVVDSMQQR